MAKIEDSELVAAKEAVTARLGALRLTDWHLRAVDRRLETYCAAVIAHPAGHCLWEQLAVERFLRLCTRYGLNARRVRAFFTFYENLTFAGASGPTHYRLTPVQCFQFASIYGFWDGERRVTREAVLFVPRKFSKTTSSAAFAVWDLLMGDSNAEAYIGANSADQARACFDAVRRALIALDPGGRRFVVNEQTVRSLMAGRSAKAQCLTANARTKDGLNASTIIMDEFSQARDAGLLGVLTTSTGARLNPLTVIITTASEVYDGPFFEMLAGYKRMLLDEGSEPRDDSVFAHLFEPDAGDAEDDPATWRKVHPHLGVTVKPDYYRQEYERAQRLGAEAQMAFRTKLLNLYTTNAAREWLTRKDVERAMRPVPPVWGPRTVATVGIDLSVCNDLTAVAAVYYDTDTARMQVVADYFFPEGALAGHADEELLRRWAAAGHLRLTEGRTIQYADIFRHIEEISRRVAIVGVAYDSYGARDLGNALRSSGYAPVLLAVPQIYGYFTSPVFFLEKYLKDGLLSLDDNPMHAWCFANCVLCENSRGFKPEKRTKAAKIDGVIAMLMAIREAVLAAHRRISRYRRPGHAALYRVSLRRHGRHGAQRRPRPRPRHFRGGGLCRGLRPERRAGRSRAHRSEQSPLRPRMGRPGNRPLRGLGGRCLLSTSESATAHTTPLNP